MSSNKVRDISRALLLLHNPPIHLMPHKEGTARSNPLFKRNGPLQIMQIVKQIKAIFQILLWFPKYDGMPNSRWNKNLKGDEIATTRKCVNSLEFFLK